MEINELKEIKEVEVIGGITENIIVKKIKPYEIEVNKYIEKVKINNKEYDDLFKYYFTTYFIYINTFTYFK